MSIYVKRTAIWSAIRTAKRLHLGDIAKALKWLYRISDGDLIECRQDEILSLVDKIDQALVSFGQNFDQKWRLYRTLKRMALGVTI